MQTMPCNRSRLSGFLFFLLSLLLGTALLPSPAAAFENYQFLHQDQAWIPGSVSTNATFGEGLAQGDFNGDGYEDLAVSAPGEDVGAAEEAGAVYVLYGEPSGLSDSGVQRWHQDVAGVEGVAEAGDNFGEFVVAGDFNGDGYDDLAIGAYFEDVGMVENAGSVNVLYGSASGLSASGDQLWHQNTAGVLDDADTGDTFGEWMATGDFNGDGYEDLAVGVDDEDIDTANSAGAVCILYGSASGLTATGNQLWHQDVTGVEGTAEAGDNFGDRLVAGDFNGDGYDDLAIGVYDDSVNTIAGAGVVNVLYGSASGLTAAGDQLWHQDVAGITGTVEENDEFGRALAAGDFNADGYDDLAIGVPREDFSGKSSAGAVNLIYGSASGLTATGDQWWHQDVGSVQDAAEADDDFGEALAAGDFNGDGYDDLAIGADEEDIDSATDAGAVNVLFGSASGLTSTGNQWWHQDVTEIISSHAEASDNFGDFLAAGDFDGDGHCDLAIGAYREDWNTTENAGLVDILLSGKTRLIYAHVDTSGSWATEICAVNNSGSAVSGTLLAYDANGKLVGTPMSVALPPHGRASYDVASTFSGSASIKYVVLTHDGDTDNVTGYTKFAITGQYRAALPASPGTFYDALYASHVASDNQWFTGLGLVNLTSVNKPFVLPGSGAPSVPSNGQFSTLIRSLFGGTPQPSIAAIEIQQASGGVGLELFGSGNQLGGIRMTGETATVLHYPHIHSDGTWWTGLVAYNPNGSAVTLTITPYTQAGAAMATQVVNLPSKGKYIGLVRDLSLPAGTAWLKVTASQPVTGFELFGTFDGKILAGFSVVNLSRTSGVFPKIEKDGFTGIALVNTTGSSRTVTLKAYNDSGALVATTSVVLAGNAKILGFVEDLFDGSNISSATYVSFTATGAVAGFQLNGSDDGMLLDGLPGM